MFFWKKHDFSPFFSVKFRAFSSQFGFSQHNLVSLTLKYLPCCAYCVFLTDFGLFVEVHGSTEVPQKYNRACLSDSLGAEKQLFFFRACLLGYVESSTM